MPHTREPFSGSSDTCKIMTDPLHDLTLGNDLAEKLRKLEALFARPGSEGERVAAGNALERLRERLRRLESSQPPVEFHFSLGDDWSRALFVALARRYGLVPFRRRGQRFTTVMLRANQIFVNDTFWPEFVELQKVLHRHLQAVTQRLIAQAIHNDVTDIGERPPSAAGSDESGNVVSGKEEERGRTEPRQA